MANLDDVAEAMLAHDSPVVTAGDLADDLGVTSRHVLDLLRLLERAGDVESKDVGARAVAWWHVERVTPPKVPVDEHPEQTALDEDPAFEPPETDTRQEPTIDENEQEVNDLVDDLRALDLPGEGDLLDERINAVRVCYEYLREEGTATRSDFIEAAYEAHSAGYGSPGGWWNAVGKKGLRELAERREDVAAPSEGAHQWRYVGEE